MAITIDTYAIVTKLKETGIPELQAAAQVEAITKLIEGAIEQAKHDYQLDELVTKRDLRETDLKIELVRSDLKREIAEIKADLVRWVVGVGILQSVLITGLMLKIAGHF